MFGKLKEKLTGGVARLNGKTDLLEAICAGCVLVGAADGDLSDDEAMVALDRLAAYTFTVQRRNIDQLEAAHG